MMDFGNENDMGDLDLNLTGLNAIRKISESKPQKGKRKHKQRYKQTTSSKKCKGNNDVCFKESEDAMQSKLKVETDFQVKRFDPEKNDQSLHIKEKKSGLSEQKFIEVRKDTFDLRKQQENNQQENNTTPPLSHNLTPLGLSQTDNGQKNIAGSLEQPSDAEKKEEEHDSNKKRKKKGSSEEAKKAALLKKHGTRSNPHRPEDLSHYHLKARDLSSGAAEAPDVSKESTHIYATGDINSFEDMGLDQKLVRVLTDSMVDMVHGKKGGLGLTQPTQVQAKAVPEIMKGKDVFIKSETGSGKTLAYLLPLVQLLQMHQPRISRSDGTFAIIIAPTRELCHQIEEVLAALVYPYVWIVPGLVTGGEKRKSEKARLRKGLSVLVATPGRLLDHLKQTQCFTKKNLKWLIIDEADRMVDLGFSKQLEEIIEHLNQERQTIMASATITPMVSKFAGKFLNEFITINVDAESEQNSDMYTTPKQLAQHFMVVTQKLRLAALSVFLRQRAAQNEKVLVFFSTCDSVDFHTSLLQASCWPVELKGKKAQKKEKDDSKSDTLPLGMFGDSFPILKLHGNITQVERTRTYARFCKTKKGVLFCTDVAARGLDLPAVDWILQYDPPTDITDYVHRIGRTARKGAQGHAVFFLLPSETQYLTVLNKHGLQPSALSLQAMLVAEATSRQKKKHNPEDLVALDIQAALEEQVSGNADLIMAGRKAFQGYVRAYATHASEAKHIFNVRSLHLGHVAKSFALKDSPTAIKVAGTVISAKKKKNQGEPSFKRKKKKRVIGKIAQKYKSDAIVNAEFG